MTILLNGYILVKKAQPKADGGIQYAQAIDDFLYRGEVVSVGDSAIKSTSDAWKGVRAGAIVTFRKDAGEETIINGEKLKAIKSEDIICYE